LPNPASKNFPYLVGLEACVEKILRDALRKGRGATENGAAAAASASAAEPSVCSKCATDFTAAWKWTHSSKGRRAATPFNVQP